jgi:hypothetical protein
VSGNGGLTGITCVESGIPESFALFQNYPNPFNSSTVIVFGVPTRSRVHLAIFDLLGQKVTGLMDEGVDPGYFGKEWHANVASGIYFYRIEAAAIDNPHSRFVETKRLLLIR